MSDIQMRSMDAVTKSKVLSELMQIAVETGIIFYSSQQIQKGIGVYPIVKAIRSSTSRLEDIKLKIKKEHQAEYLTANATGKIQWRAEYIVLAVKKIIELLEVEENCDPEYALLPEKLAEQIKYFKKQNR